MASLIQAVNNNDHVMGNHNAPIEMVEYGDYECPFCGQAYQMVKSIQDEMGNNLRFVFRNFPLSERHPYATRAAIATEAAAAQGKFWEMHDILFENQKNLTDKDLIQHAKQIGLDIEKFRSDLDNPEFKRKVDNDFETGLRSGVNKTPSFFINGEIYNGATDKEALLNHMKELA